MKINYNLCARYIPTILNIIPVIVFINLVVDVDLIEIPVNNFIKFLGMNLSMGGILIYFFSLLFRILSKTLIENKLFKNQALFPTTKFLLNNNKISPEFKNNILEKIKNDFKLDLKNSNDTKIIIDAIGLIRKRVGDGHLVLRRNIEYGFMRNLIVGAPLTLIFCSIIIINKNETGYSILFGIYGGFALILFLCCKTILNYLAEQYAKQLFYEYLDT